MQAGYDGSGHTIIKMKLDQHDHPKQDYLGFTAFPLHKQGYFHKMVQHSGVCYTGPVNVTNKRTTCTLIC